MNRIVGPVVCMAGGLAVLAAMSGQIAGHIGASQSAVLTAVICGYAVLLVMLVILVRRRNPQR